MDINIEALFQEMENDSELQQVKQRLTALEAQIKSRVSEDVWLLLLEWEAVWAEYLTVCVKRVYAVAYEAGKGVKEG